MTTITTKLADNDEDLLGILDLQRENHLANVSSETKSTEGFVTVKHTLSILRQMNEKASQVIAIDNNKVIGYALVMVKEFKYLLPVLTPMFEAFEDITYKNKKLSDCNYYVMGQVCVAKSHRGMGVFQSLYNKQKKSYSHKYDICLTEVSSSNPRSIRAHEKVGFKTIHTFKDITDEWHIIGWDWNL
ncbi:GNAT family N-acetyltransferase [Fulvivirga sediminis]|uniref:GNAT family N-acetyltransferase n=1 Tax=Fulvivirga sediminis TaxID=2803949 RepID=A0A937K1Z9_9BACT|nr:GNAT family N-acetyltransferase [Fulvivirga sediminis]MBL3658031.1 GNAT family N-acetyltransferase [Fulvivirga sediminis]